MTPAAFARAIRALGGIHASDSIMVEPFNGHGSLLTWSRTPGEHRATSIPLKPERVIARIIDEAKRANLSHDVDYEGWAATLTFSAGARQ
jgi:hypothetical protein